MINPDKSLSADLEERIRAQTVRADERIALLRTLGEPEGVDELRRRIETLKQRMEAASAKVRGALR